MDWSCNAAWIMTSLVTLLTKVKGGSGETWWLTNLYTYIYQISYLSWAVQGVATYKLRCCNIVIMLTLELTLWLCCIHSNLTMFLAKYGFQIEVQYSKCGRIYVLYSIRNNSLVRWVKVPFISPRDCIALVETLSHCNVKSCVIQTPKSFLMIQH